MSFRSEEHPSRWGNLVRTSGLIVALVAAPFVATADDEPDYGRTGPYVSIGASVGTAIGYENQIESVAGLQGRVDSAVGAEARVGYRVIPHVAVEAQADWIPGFDAKVDNDVKIVDGRTLLVTANAKAYARPDTRFQPFALLGVGYMKTENQLIVGPSIDGDGFALRAGGGIDAHFNEHWALSIDISYVVPTGAISDFDYVDIGIGALYRF